jgi:hypothetical protein
VRLSHLRCASVAAAAATLLSACDGGVATRGYVYNRDIRAHVQYAAYASPTQLVIFNSPFDASAVTAAMQGRNPGPPITFSTGPGTSGYRVVLVFGAPFPGTANICQAQSVGAAPAPADRTEISAVFCIGPALISEATASTSRIGSAQDPRLGRLMQDLVSALMPYNDPQSTNDLSGRQ